MKLSVVSSKKRVDGEIGIIVNLFEKGLTTFHLRKNHYSKSKLKNFLKAIPKEYHSRIVLHSHQMLATKFNVQGVHFSTRQLDKSGYLNKVKMCCKLLGRKMSFSRGFDNLSDLITERKYWDFVILNPVFDTVSDDPKATAFSNRAISSSLEQTGLKVAGLGGICIENLEMMKNFGFHEAILNGEFWNSEKRITTFLQAQTTCENLNKPENVVLRKVAN
ncbi:MAG: thiamine phosphate synthase [Bacteroidota bacterium]